MSDIVVTIQHAGHVHFFKHAIRILEANGHSVHIFARENEASTTLLDRCGFEYERLAGPSASLPSLAVSQFVYEARLLWRARRIQPDVMTAVGGVAVSHVARAVGAESVVFYDTEHATLIRRLAFPFADTVCTPAAYRYDEGGNHVRYPSFHELAYLHPDRFSPDPTALDTLAVTPDDRIVIVRLGGWDSSHDVGASGFDDPVEFVDALDRAGAEVFLTTERDPPDGLEAHSLDLPPERFHDLLAHADLYVGEGATTAAEAAVLGTPAVYVSTLPLGYLSRLEAYGLVTTQTGDDRHRRGLEAALDLLDRTNSDEWARRRDRLLEDHVDTTTVIVDHLTGRQSAESPGGDEAVAHRI